MLSQSRKYPIVQIKGKDTVVVMTVKQADAINSKLQNMQSQIDSLNSVIEQKNKELRMNRVCDSLENKFREMANGPTFIYNYLDSVYTIDLSLYKIKLNSLGRVKFKKLNRWQIGRYFELMNGEPQYMVDWKEVFRDYELPLIEENKPFISR